MISVPERSKKTIMVKSCFGYISLLRQLILSSSVTETQLVVMLGRSGERFAWRACWADRDNMSYGQYFW